MCVQGLAKPPVVKLVQIAPFVLSVLNDTSYRLRASSAKMHRFVLRLVRASRQKRPNIDGLAHPSLFLLNISCFHSEHMLG